MAKPRVFISSTFYDLKHIRSDIERFIKEMGYEPIRNENGDIPYGVENDLEDYCYKEVIDVDILIGIIGNRYGADSKEENHSITQLEIKTAFQQGKQVYIFIDKNVYSEYGTYSINKGKDIAFKYVDNIKIYNFIEEIMSIKAGIIIQPFENVYDITNYLKIQWAGLFRDFLRQNSENKQLTKLSNKINDLETLTETIKTYFEKALPNVLGAGTNVQEIINEENEHIKEKKLENRLDSLPYIKHLLNVHKLNIDEIKTGLTNYDNIYDLIKYWNENQKIKKGFHCIHTTRLVDINIARELLGKKPYNEDSQDIKDFLFKGEL